MSTGAVADPVNALFTAELPRVVLPVGTGLLSQIALVDIIAVQAVDLAELVVDIRSTLVDVYWRRCRSGECIVYGRAAQGRVARGNRSPVADRAGRHNSRAGCRPR